MFELPIALLFVTVIVGLRGGFAALAWIAGVVVWVVVRSGRHDADPMLPHAIAVLPKRLAHHGTSRLASPRFHR